MKYLNLTPVLLFCSALCFGQNKEEAEKLVNQGISLQDKGESQMAISKYDSALQIDKDNLLALAEKAYTLFSIQKYEESIEYCKKAIDVHPKDEALRTVYVTYGNDYDLLNNTKKSISIYNEGIKQFPDYYQLYFNKGISLSSIQKKEDAISCFQEAILLNPNHASSHNALARLSNTSTERIPAILAYVRFLTIEPQSNRAKENLLAMQTRMRGNIQQTGDKVTINISSDVLNGSSKKKTKKNNFSSSDLILSLDAATDFDEKNKNKTEVEQFIRKLETLCSSLKETREVNYGFYWSYYVPYFIQLKDEGLIETLAYISFASSETPDVSNWLNSHKSEIDKFFTWSKSFKWETKRS